MNSEQHDKDDRVGELATDLDDLALNVEELQVDPPPHVDQAQLDTIKKALEEASDATDELINEQTEESPVRT